MEKTTKSPESSELYRKIDALSLTPAVRVKAFAALRHAELLIDGMISLGAKAKQFGSTAPNAVPTGKLKHQ